jgi:hypothetical protein
MLTLSRKILPNGRYRITTIVKKSTKKVPAQESDGHMPLLVVIFAPKQHLNPA